MSVLKKWFQRDSSINQLPN